MTDYLLSALSVAACFGMSAMALDLIFGHLGAFYLAGGMLFGIGAYAYALMAAFDPWLALCAACLCSAMAGCLTAAPFIHLTQRPSFLFVTLALQLLAFEACNNLVDLTRGAAGIAGIPAPSLGFWPGDSATGKFLLTMGAVFAAVRGYGLWHRSRHARLVNFLRQNEWTCAELGMIPGLVKLQAIGLAALGLGAAGALYALNVAYVSPRDASLDTTIAMAPVVLAVPRAKPWNVAGLGALFYIFPEAARFFDAGTTTVPAIRTVLFGAILLCIGIVRQRRRP